MRLSSLVVLIVLSIWIYTAYTQCTEVLGLAPLQGGQGLDAFCGLSTSTHICTILWWWTVVWWREPSARSLQSEMIHLSVIIITPSWWASIHCTGIPTLLQRLTSTLFSFDLTQYWFNFSQFEGWRQFSTRYTVGGDQYASLQLFTVNNDYGSTLGGLVLHPIINLQSLQGFHYRGSFWQS